MMRIAVFIINPQLEGEGCGWGVLDHIIYNSMPTFSSTQCSMAAVNASTSRVMHINVCHRSSGRPQETPIWHGCVDRTHSCTSSGRLQISWADLEAQRVRSCSSSSGGRRRSNNSAVSEAAQRPRQKNNSKLNPTSQCWSANMCGCKCENHVRETSE